MGTRVGFAALRSRQRIIVVIGSTPEDIQAGVAHARTGSSDLPIRAWCLSHCDPVPGCDRLTSSSAVFQIWADICATWPALVIAPWTGAPGLQTAFLKAIPLLVPPFRAVIRNEADGFFPMKPGPVFRHLFRRTRDLLIAAGNRLQDWAKGSRVFYRSLTWNIQDRWKGLRLFFSSVMWNLGDRLKGLGLFLWSLLWNACDRAKGVGLLLASAAWHVFDWLRNSAEFCWELVLSFAAWLARATGPLAYEWLKNRPVATGNIQARSLPSCGSGTVEIGITGRTWHRSAILRALRRSDADFALLRMQGSKADATPLVSIAQESGAFAVAFQAGYAGWRKTAFRNHPFRKLEPGEITEVIAPASHTIAIRREALLELGLPHAVTAGAALTALFLRASAAGWRNLVCHSPGQLTHEPAMELEDLEVALRSGQTPLPPRLPLQRGNVMWSPRHSKKGRGLPRVLVVSPYLPFPLSHGGAVRIYNLCRELADRFDFTLACFREAGEAVHYPELHEVFRNVFVIDNDEKHRDASVPLQVAEYRNAAMKALVTSLCAGGAVDLLQLEYTQMAEYRECAGSVPVVLVEHDITFTLHQQLADRAPFDAAKRAEAERWLAFETLALQNVSAVWTMSPLDRETALRHGAPADRTFVVPNGVDLRRFESVENHSSQQRILFVGSFRHLPNLLAYECLRETILPAIWKVLPGAVLHVIAGPDHERAAANAGKAALLTPDSRVLMEGFVTDVRPAYHSCDVVVIPLPVSAGTNIKLMEAMSCGRAVVSTLAGCIGLGLEDGEDLLIREIGPAFSEAIIQLLRDQDLRASIAHQARRTAVERLGWDRIANTAAESCSLLVPSLTYHQR